MEIIKKHGKRIIRRPNGGIFHADLIEWALNYKQIALISETKETRKFVESLIPTAHILSFGREDSDIYWNVYKDEDSWYYYGNEFDCIICQALIEHITCPFLCIFKLSKILRHNGVLCIHTHPPSHKYHAKKNFKDCLRFYKDFFEEVSEQLPLRLEECKKIKSHWLVRYKKS